MENSQRFIVVIDVDNKRAYSAYMKGISDIELIWPQIEEYCEKKFSKYAEWYKQKNKVWEEDHKNYMGEIATFYDQIKNLEKYKKSTSIFKGPRPNPILPDISPISFERIYMLEPKSPIAYYESIRKNLMKMANLSKAALGPFRMTENLVDEMIGWENGTKIEHIKLEISETV